MTAYTKKPICCLCAQPCDCVYGNNPKPLKPLPFFEGGEHLRWGKPVCCDGCCAAVADARAARRDEGKNIYGDTPEEQDVKWSVEHMQNYVQSLMAQEPVAEKLREDMLASRREVPAKRGNKKARRNRK